LQRLKALWAVFFLERGLTTIGRPRDNPSQEPPSSFQPSKGPWVDVEKFIADVEKFGKGVFDKLKSPFEKLGKKRP
jgi:hypothetical protein